MRRHALLPLLAFFAFTAQPASASFLVQDIADPISIPSSFAFTSELGSDYSLFTQTSNLSSIALTGAARITFYALGSESALENNFFFGPLSATENDYSYDPTRLIGSIDINSPTNLGGLVFTSSSGLPAVPGTSNFGIFLPLGFSETSYLTDTLIFGYDDGANGDNDYDDFVVLAQISPIPEARTWLLMLAGFGFVGMQLRRRKYRHMSTAY
jgi:hypothetical protein